MPRILFGLAVVYVAVLLYTVFDVIQRPAERVRVMPKVAWILVAVFVPVVGLVLWYVFGRGAPPQAPAPGLAPDDDPEFLRKLSEDLDFERQRRRNRGGNEDPHNT